MRFAAILLLLSAFATAQQPTPPPATSKPAAVTPAKSDKFEPSEVQKLRLEVKQKDALISQLQGQLVQLQGQVNGLQQRSAYQGLLDECKAVAKENGWAEDVSCNPQTLAFAKAPAKTPAGK